MGMFGNMFGEYLEMGIYEENADGFIMKGNVAKPRNETVMFAFKNLQLRINDVLYLHGRGSEIILADGDIGPTTRLRALTVAKYVGGSSYLDMFVQAPSEKLLARYAVEIAVDLARAAPPNAPPFKPATNIPGMPTGPITDTPGIPGTGNDIKKLVESNAAKMVGLFGIGYLLLKDKKGKRKYTRKRKPAKRRRGRTTRRRSYKRRSRRR